MSAQTNRKTLPGFGWHHEDVKAEIRKRYGSLSAFSRENGLSRQSVSGALINPLASIRIEKLIASALEVQAHSIWPNRWQVDGKPVPRKIRMQLIAEAAQKQTKKDAE
jgi:Ner family transcriptional regulator